MIVIEKPVRSCYRESLNTDNLYKTITVVIPLLSGVVIAQSFMQNARVCDSQRELVGVLEEYVSIPLCQP